MALNLARTNYDAGTHDNGKGPLELPWFSDHLHAYYLARFGSIPSSLLSNDWRPAVRGDLARVNRDLTLVLNGNTGVSNLSYAHGPARTAEWEVRNYLAGLGFKPDAESWRQGRLIQNLTFDRTSDLEAVSAARGIAFPALDPLVTSMVVPYIIATFTPPGVGQVAVNIPATAGIANIHGWTRPSPWPRVLNGYRIWDLTSNSKAWPRGHVIGSDSGSGPRFQVIQTDGTFLLQKGTDPALTPTNNTVLLQGGRMYQLEVGHAEAAGHGTWRHQRWPGWTWKPGDGITY